MTVLSRRNSVQRRTLQCLPLSGGGMGHVEEVGVFVMLAFRDLPQTYPYLGRAMPGLLEGPAAVGTKLCRPKRVRSLDRQPAGIAELDQSQVEKGDGDDGGHAKEKHPRRRVGGQRRGQEQQDEHHPDTDHNDRMKLPLEGGIPAQ